MSNDSFSRIRAFAGPNALEPRSALMSTLPGPAGPTGPVGPLDQTIIRGFTNNLKLIQGSVLDTGVGVLPLNGYTCSSTSLGQYTILFNNAFASSDYSIVATPESDTPIATCFVESSSKSSSSFVLNMYNLSGSTPVACGFTFIAIGVY